MKDFAKSIKTCNADLGLRPIVSELTKDIAKIYEENGKDREKTKRELIEKHHFTEKEAEESLRKIVGNSKVGNGYIGQYSKTQTEKKFDDILADIAELADMASEYAFMSEQIQNAKSVLNDIISRANQAKSLADKISEEWKKTGGRK